MGSARRIAAPVLGAVIEECFVALGLASSDSAAVAEVLVDANLRGIDSHGFQRVPIYMRRVGAGLAGGTTDMKVVADAGCMCRMDAANALGPAAAVKAVGRAVALGQQHGVGLVTLRRGSHFGAAGFYARKVACSGMVGMVMTNAVARMAPFGATEAFFGTNPLAIGVPLPGREPLVLDMSSSVAAQGRITRARDLGTAIPEGWAVDADGRPTTDPARALAGSLLSVGGPKGSGLAMAISALAVLLAGADCDDQMGSMYRDFDRPQNVGQVFLAIDHGRLADPTDGDRLSEMVGRLEMLPPVSGSTPVRYPGQDGAVLAARRRRDGIPIEDADVRQVVAVCVELGLETVARRVATALEVP